MAKTIGTIIGVLLVLAGIASFFANPVVGMGGYFVANTGYGIAMIVVGVILLLAAAYGTAQQKRGWNGVLGVILILFAIAGFVLVPLGGILLGFVISATDTVANLILGIVLLLTGIFEPERDRIVTQRIVRTTSYV